MSQSETAPPQTSEQHLRHSSKFPEGYGNLALRSSDNMIFHFPLFLLAYVSPVFKDMCEFGGNTSNSEVIQMSEDSKMIDHILSFIDPEQETPNFSWENIEEVLLVAEKYQIKSILRWFQKEVRTEAEIGKGWRTAVEKPMLCLGLGIQYGYPEVAKLGLRDLLRCHVSQLAFHPAVSAHLAKEILTLRAERTSRICRAILSVEDRSRETSKRFQCSIHRASSPFWRNTILSGACHHPNWSYITNYLQGITPNSYQAKCSCELPYIPTELNQEMQELENKVPDLPEGSIVSPNED
ncbi:hypothetical protein CPB86DRAFT_787455 [Serendipita vermifera]|nr:hypothetical protein CPB86DRAFT_787455 [Serendipita vermifera]